MLPEGWDDLLSCGGKELLAPVWSDPEMPWTVGSVATRMRAWQELEPECAIAGRRRAMARRSETERKRRTREHVLADLSANYVEKQALLCGYTAERVRLDYGIDLVVQMFNKVGEVESSRLLFQLKATDRIRTTVRANAVSCRIERADLGHWLEEPFPVVLVLYDAKIDAGYWLYVQNHFANLPGFDLARCGKRLTLVIPRLNVLDRKAMKRLARVKNVVAGNYRKVWTHAL